MTKIQTVAESPSVIIDSVDLKQAIPPSETLDIDGNKKPNSTTIYSHPIQASELAILKKHSKSKWKNDPPKDPPAEEKELPMEPNSFYGFWLVIGSIILSFVTRSVLLGFAAATATTATTALSLIAGVLGLISGIAFIAGLVLGIIALGIHKRNPNKYRGKGKAMAAVLIPAISILISLFFLAIVLLLFLLVV